MAPMFHGFEVVPGKEHKLVLEKHHSFHLSVVSVKHGVKGRSTLYVTVDGESFSLLTLDVSQQLMQTPVDIVFGYEQEVVFRVKGNAVLHCCGYQQESEGMLSAALSGSGEYDNAEEEEEEEEGEDTGLDDGDDMAGVPLTDGKKNGNAATKRQQVVDRTDDSDDDDDEDEEDDEDDEDDEDEDDEDEDEDDDDQEKEEDEDEEPPAKKQKVGKSEGHVAQQSKQQQRGVQEPPRNKSKPNFNGNNNDRKRGRF
ncbi:nucleolar RNA-binding protein, putative [Trypanosoma brucei brucei TREU927]|uniref:Nucleolar RNA-binding protein, putative n=1 Tax=Trypanosoma brucei brucei (strain 927/4 GUTat10.1) TaxID=185431 RepID=Q57YF7_TRYB2|nr:nucleolar RNA-binding protein, putative [Trypanosoma brucei brucei TREU927]AAX69361.1 nucleolar RNA-binding protein, putative [Trypanosoma brucei]AAZ12844.1 nucleolar RNA-binding protein, putative [Trypanosoma brucei brucei TREU927]